MKHFILIMAVSCLMFTAISSLSQETTETPEPEATPITTRDTIPDISTFELKEVASGFEHPLYITHAGDGSGRLFVAEQSGRIWIMGDDGVSHTLFLDLSDRVSQDILYGYSERGLLGLAFHPNYAENGRLFVDYTDRNGTTHISEFLASPDNPDLVPRQGERVILSINQPYANHNGGHMSFGPDGYLYISVGDGGSAGDPNETGQNPSDLLGSILRIDVDNVAADQPYAIPADNPYSFNAAFAPEVWSYGFRNVWRFSFDRATGDLYIADVGQGRYEEVNFQPADSPGGENYGWDVFEGLELYEGWMGEQPVDTVMPIATYDHTNGCSITGGHVYRGEAIPELTATYFYSDFCQGNIWAAYRDSSGTWRSGMLMRAAYQTSSFGEDEDGELYLIDYSGRILKFVPTN